MLKKKNNKGFTLVELLVVIAIIGILAVVAVPALFKNINKAKVADVEADYNAIKSAVLSYYADENQIPSDGDIVSINAYMDNVPTKSSLGEGSYTFKEMKLPTTSTTKSLYLVIGERKLKETVCGAHEQGKTHGDEDSCYEESQGVTLTSDQSKKLKSDLGENMIYVSTSKSSYESISDSTAGQNIVVAIKLIDNTSSK